MWKSKKDVENQNFWIKITILIFGCIFISTFIIAMNLTIRLEKIEELEINNFEEVCFDWITIETKEYIIPDQIYNSSCANYINCFYDEKQGFLLCNSSYIENFWNLGVCFDSIPYVHYYNKTICDQTILVKKK